ncbi:hypothetical protein [Trujillonella endophytica]|uniref:Uncharacterized protein n=1 Tax=Trujillonella endophytica TaxID=673521 RepID=A0A1H8P912_9ACTN|nr:hypothetical protein [Trujillella endophytica]SEO38439.1 hypothetical protein SAMN05660991_00039 [Trujillella endophytica]
MRDIREVPAEEYWDELRRRWGGLLSYRYIGAQFSSMNANITDPSVTLRRDMRNAAGGIMAAPLSICSPGGIARSDLEAVPNPVIHSLQILDDAVDVRRVLVTDSVSLHEGRRMGYSRTKIVDADDPDRVIAFIESQGASIGDVPPGLGKFDDDPIDHIEDSPDLPPLWQVFGGSRRDDGHWVLPELTVELASPDAALHIGPQHVILEAAAVELAAERAGTDRLQVWSKTVMHLSRGKVGPFRVDGTTSTGRDGSGRIGVQLTMFDEGNGDRAVTSAAFVFGPARA